MGRLHSIRQRKSAFRSFFWTVGEIKEIEVEFLTAVEDSQEEKITAISVAGQIALDSVVAGGIQSKDAGSLLKAAEDSDLVRIPFLLISGVEERQNSNGAMDCGKYETFCDNQIIVASRARVDVVASERPVLHLTTANGNTISVQALLARRAKLVVRSTVTHHCTLRLNTDIR